MTAFLPRSFYKRKADTHKGTYGHVLIVAGSVGMTGAPVLCAAAALRAGAGLVTLAVPRAVYRIVARKAAPEVMVHPLGSARAETLSAGALRAARGLLERADVLVAGPGLSRSAGAAAAVRRLVVSSPRPWVLDADGINAFCGKHRRVLAEAKSRGVLTPHPGEMGRLLGISTAKVQRERKAVALGAARALKTVVVLKGHRTVIASPDGKVRVNSTGNPGMATAGMGDVLSGVIAALAGQGLGLFEAAAAGAYLHGLAGDLAAKKVGQVSLTACDVLRALPAAFRRGAGRR